MSDFGQAALLTGIVYGGVEVAKKFIPTGWSLEAAQQATIGAAAVIGQLTAFLVAESAWGNEQVVGGKPLDTLNTFSLIVVGIALALAAITFHKILGAVKNVGQNTSDDA